MTSGMPSGAVLRRVTADELDSKDVIFDSLRLDYPGFDEWLAKCARDRRVAWFVDRGVKAGRARYGAVCIVDANNRHGYGWDCDWGHRALKICTLKVCELEAAKGWSEILIRQAVAEARLAVSIYAFAEVFPKQARLIALLMTFGFEPVAASPKGEVVLRLRVVPMGFPG